MISVEGGALTSEQKLHVFALVLGKSDDVEGRVSLQWMIVRWLCRFAPPWGLIMIFVAVAIQKPIVVVIPSRYPIALCDIRLAVHVVDWLMGVWQSAPQYCSRCLDT